MRGNVQIACVYDDEDRVDPSVRPQIMLSFTGENGEMPVTQGLSLNSEQARGLAYALLAGGKWLDGLPGDDFRLSVECDFTGWV